MLRLQTLTEKGFAFLILLLLAGFMDVLLSILFGAPPDGASQGNPVEQAMWSGIYLATFFFLLLRYRRVLYAATRNKATWLLIGLLVGLALISVVWSATPGATVRNGIALAGTTLFGCYLATCYSLREQLRLLAWALGIMALLSLLYALLVPSGGLAIDPDGSFSEKGMTGVFGHKQALGKTMALGAVVFFIFATSSRRYRWLASACCAFAFSLILFSNSVGALLLVLAFVTLWPLCKLLQWRYTAAVPFLIIAVLLGWGAAMLVLTNAPTVLAAFERDMTITGRTFVWSAVLDMIREQPWLGYGYGAFWRGWEGPSAQVWLATGYEFPNAHNAILTVWLDLGLLGVSVFVLGFLWGFLRAVAWIRYTKTAEGLWPLMYLTFFALNGLVEATAPHENSLYWVLFVAAILTPITQHGRYRKIANDMGLVRKISTRMSEEKMPGKLADGRSAKTAFEGPFTEN